MKPFQYQVLRYLPDRVGGEFVNLGVVLYAPKENYLKMKVLDRVGRLSHFFEGLNPRHVIQGAKHLEHAITSFGDHLRHELDVTQATSIEEITMRFLVPDDSSLIFSEMRTGMDTDMDIAFDDLFRRMVLQYVEEQAAQEFANDEEVWKKHYKKYFDSYGVTKMLTHHAVKTSIAQIDFDMAWQNGSWHCYQPIKLDLKTEERILHKVYRWEGELGDVQQTKDPITIHFLGYLPKKPKLRQFILKKLNRSWGNVTAAVVEESKAEAFARQLKLDLEKHANEG